MKKIRILVVEPNKEPYQVKIEYTLRNLQNIVGGLIDIIELEKNIDLICNDEGKILGLPTNRITEYDIIAGTFIVAAQQYGEMISLSRKQIKKYKKVFNLSKHKKYITFLKQNITNKNFWNDVEKHGLEKGVKKHIKKIKIKA